jgi:glycosyltransferase involved in cell wall biosynthesis
MLNGIFSQYSHIPASPDRRLPRRNILFTSSFTSPFILEDAEILRGHGEVTHVLTRSAADLLRLPGAVSRADVTFSWFASTYAGAVVSLAHIARKPSIVVLGGADVVTRPEIGYGMANSAWKRRLLIRTLRTATRLLPVDPSLRDAALALAPVRPEAITVLPTGYDETAWLPGPKESDLVLTVAGCETEDRMKVKGIDRLLRVAKGMPGVRFVVIGMDPRIGQLLAPECPANVRLLGPVERAELHPWYQRASVYCQPSLSEGLPNALCEAMLCGCIPVGTDVGGMPYAIGDAGIIVQAGNDEELGAAIRIGLQSATDKRARARARIAREFPLTRRREALAALLAELCP